MIENRILKNLVVTGYSGGSGKTHLLVKKILPLVADTHQFSISHTTRKPRGKEEEGKDYYYTDVFTFLAMVHDGEFLEWSNPREGVYYGTSVAEYQRITAAGKAVAFDIDFKGVVQLSQHPITEDTLCVIAPLPNTHTRHRWMIKRGDMPEETMSLRLAYSEQFERPFFEDERYDHLIHWKLKPYDETLPLPDDILANIVANHICGYTTTLGIPEHLKSLAAK